MMKMRRMMTAMRRNMMATTKMTLTMTLIEDLTTRYWSTQSPSVGDKSSVSTKSTRT